MLLEHPDEIFPEFHRVPEPLLLRVVLLDRLTREMHGHHIFLCLKENTILTLILTGECVYQHLHTSYLDVDNVKCVFPRDNY